MNYFLIKKKAYAILDEMVIGGEIMETSKKTILEAV
jgi:hypothetical protein